MSDPMTPEARIYSGDTRIRELLEKNGTVVQHAFACRLDGFANDTFTEYANPSVYRPPSVCRARLQTSIQYTFTESGDFYLAFTMYATAGARERIHVHFGAEEIAIAEHPDPDNRLHLFVVPGKRRFIGGETVRLLTEETTGPCRIENIVLLAKAPASRTPRLRILDPHIEIEPDGNTARAIVTWRTSRPASGRIEWAPLPARGKATRRRLSEPRANHEYVIPRLKPGQRYSYSITMQDRTGERTAEKQGTFRTTRSESPRTPSSGSIPILLRRKGTGPWPVSIGVPFRQGALGSLGNIRLTQCGSEIPAQARALSTWPDGSVKWALLDFRSDGQSDATVSYGPDISTSACAQSLKVVRSREELKVDTGAMRVTLSRNRLGLPGRVEVQTRSGEWKCVASEAAGGAVQIVDAKGREFQGARPDSIDVEEDGQNRVCVRVTATHHGRGDRSLFRSIFRYQFFAGSTAVRCLHTFENDVTDSAFTEIRSLSLRLGLDVGTSVRASLEQSDDRPLGRSTVRLEQLHDDRWEARAGSRATDSGHRAAGLATISGSHGTLAFAAKQFWQNYPKALSVSRNTLTLDICPQLPKGLYPDEGELEDRLFFWYKDGLYRLKRGMARTHEFWFDFAQEDPAALSSSVNEPPIYSVDLQTFNDSSVLTQLPDRSPSPYPPYERWVEAARAAYADDRTESRAWGMFNFGDWFGERTYNWGNMEYDTPWCFLQEFLRGGQTDFFEWGDEAARHLVDVDTCHHDGEDGFLHNHYLHSIGHVGDYYPDGYRPRSICSARTSVSHTWVEGLFLHHALTGDPRSLESAEKVSANLVGSVLNDYDFTNCRNSGWHLIHLSAAYRATGRRVFLNAARIIVDRVLERQRETGGWDRLMVPGHCYCDPPRHTGNAGFMVGILMVGLKRFHEATGEQRVADAIVRAADYCIDRMWVSSKSAFHYTCCPKSSVGSGADMRILKGVAAAYGFTGRRRFRDVLMAGVKTAMAGNLPRAHRGIGKGICSPMRGAPQVLASLPE